MIEAKRAAIEPDEDHLKLLIILDKGYVDIIRMIRQQTTRIDLSNHIFMSIFEASNICGESGAHKYVESIEIGSEMDFSGRKAYAVAATLTINLNAYNRLRRVKARGTPPYPEFTVVAGG